MEYCGIYGLTYFITKYFHPNNIFLFSINESSKKRILQNDV